MKSKGPQGMVVVITGASSGIGRAAALQFAEAGASVALAARSDDLLAEIAGQCDRLGGRGLAVPTDVTDEAQVQALAERVLQEFGRIDVWVNNAAVTLFGRLEESPYEACRRVIDTNFFGYLHGARAAIARFRQQGRGVLINVSSVVSKTGQPFASMYAASKFAVNGLSESLRMELVDAPGIHVCTVLPASIDTPLFQHAANYSGRAIKPMKPVYTPDEVAEAIVDLSVRPRREVHVGGAAVQMHLMRTFAPELTESILARKVDSDHFQNRPARPTDGNLTVPMRQYNATRGGWGGRSSVQHNARRWLEYAVFGLGLGVGVALLASSRVQRQVSSVWKPKPSGGWHKTAVQRLQQFAGR